jgi:hypothetical protein
MSLIPIGFWAPIEAEGDDERPDPKNLVDVGWAEDNPGCVERMVRYLR